MSGLFAKTAGRVLGLATLAGAAVLGLGMDPASAHGWRRDYYDRPVYVAPPYYYAPPAYYVPPPPPVYYAPRPRAYYPAPVYYGPPRLSLGVTFPIR